MTLIHNSLSECYEDYIEKSAEVQAKTKPLDGIFGFRSQSKNHPCHEEFFDEVKVICANMAGDPEITDVSSEVELIMFKPKEQEKMLCYWYLMAAQQHIELLLPKLTPSQAKDFLDRYVEAFPKKDWLPCHVKLVKAMKKRAKAKA